MTAKVGKTDQAELVQREWMKGIPPGELSKRFGVSADVVSKILRPPRPVRELVRIKARSQCEACGFGVGEFGQYHQLDATGADKWSAAEELVYLCYGCHWQWHWKPALEVNQ